MLDYSSWKVTDLKAELKRRGIPQTGLRVKQNFVDRLIEDDNQKNDAAVTAAGDASAENVEGAAEEEARQEQAQESGGPSAPTEDVAEKESQETPAQRDGGDKGQAPEVAVAEDIAAGHTAAGQTGTELKPEIAAEQEAESKPEDPTDQQPPEFKSEVAADQPTEPKPEATTEQITESEPEATADQVSEPAPEAQNEPTAEPVEQAPEVAVAQEDTSAEPEVREPEAAKPEVPAPEVAAPDGPSEQAASEQLAPSGTELSTPTPMEEVIEDARKRKRRSVTPVPAPEEIAKKKIRTEEGSPRVVLKEDIGAGGPPDDAAPLSPREVPEDRPAEEIRQPEDLAARQASITEESRGRKAAPDARFKGLFAAAEPEPIRPASPSGDAVMEDAEVEPALHVATAAIYIDGLMRPLQPAALRNHLVSLATPPGDSPDPNIVLDFYLDPIKTHCLVSFTSISAASRVRSALHNTVWPNERNRKTLFVDFVPEDKLQEWIGIEDESQRRGGPPPRWEVKYDSTPDGVEAVLREVDLKASAPRGREPNTTRPPPLGPRASFTYRDRRPSAQQTADGPSRPGQGFKALDDLFRSTTTKPKLYYLPVPRDVVDRRLDRFDDLIRKGSYPRRGGDETRRISFEDTDHFVDNGPEYGGRNRRRRRGRRGGFGDSWRRDR